MIEFDLKKALDVLQRTPEVLFAKLTDFDSTWIRKNEGGDSWSVYDIIGHLIHGEKTDWIDRTMRILEHGADKPFVPFDRFAQLAESQNRSINDMLEEFEALRKQNLIKLKHLKLAEWDYDKKGMHPALGEVTLRQLLSTWVVHDLNHLSQINRVLAYQWKDSVGPWKAYLRIVKDAE